MMPAASPSTVEPIASWRERFLPSLRTVLILAGIGILVYNLAGFHSAFCIINGVSATCYYSDETRLGIAVGAVLLTAGLLRSRSA